MKVLFGERASTILNNFMLSIDHNKPFLLPSNICPTPLKSGKVLRYMHEEHVQSDKASKFVDFANFI